MNVQIIYCHPSADSFTREVFESFKRGVADSGHTYTVSDLYGMNFTTDMSEREYLRDAYYNEIPTLAADVLAEQVKINNSDAIAFIYPVFWTEAPAKLVGWFDRVWTYGFAYGEKRMKLLEKALILCIAGNKIADLERFGLLAAMKKVMLGDRLFNRVKKSDFIVFDGMSREFGKNRKTSAAIFLEQAYSEGLQFFAPKEKAFSLEGKNFIAVENSCAGEVGGETVFAYRQKGCSIWAEYSGGRIVKGFLAGTIDGDKTLRFGYRHVNTEGEVKSGVCVSVPQITQNGKLRYLEAWQWDDGEKGTSVIEEL